MRSQPISPTPMVPSRMAPETGKQSAPAPSIPSPCAAAHSAAPDCRAVVAPAAGNKGGQGVCVCQKLARLNGNGNDWLNHGPAGTGPTSVWSINAAERNASRQRSPAAVGIPAATAPLVGCPGPSASRLVWARQAGPISQSPASPSPWLPSSGRPAPAPYPASITFACAIGRKRLQAAKRSVSPQMHRRALPASIIHLPGILVMRSILREPGRTSVPAPDPTMILPLFPGPCQAVSARIQKKSAPLPGGAHPSLRRRHCPDIVTRRPGVVNS
jgi:hypothetical protein